MNDSDVYWTFQAAIEYGGGFYQALAKAGIRADPGNRVRLLKAFPELHSTYGPASRLHKKIREVAA